MHDVTTKEGALRICRELWLWLAENPDCFKQDWPKWKEYGHFHAQCPCCEYVKREHANPVDVYLRCSACPLIWEGGECQSDNSPFEAWKSSWDDFIRILAAWRIVVMCDEALQELESGGHS